MTVVHYTSPKPNIVQAATAASGAAAAATASSSTAATAGGDKASELAALRKAINDALKRAAAEASAAQQAQERVGDIQAKVQTQPKAMLALVSQTRPKLDEQAERASKISGEKAERVGGFRGCEKRVFYLHPLEQVQKMLASVRTQVDQMEARATAAPEQCSK